MSFSKKGFDRSAFFETCYEQEVDSDAFVRVVDCFVDSLVLSTFGFSSREAKTGSSYFPDSSLLKLYIFGYHESIRSSRKLAKQCKVNIEFRWLMKNLRPQKSTISSFRKDHGKAIEKVFSQLVVFLKTEGLIEGKVVAFDGSKFSGNNSRKNNHTASKIERQQSYVTKQLDKYIAALDEEDLNESDKDTLESKIAALKKKKQGQDELKKKLTESDANQISTTDEQARLLAINPRTNVVGYNVQTAVDAKHKLIAHYDVINTTDSNVLSGMAIATKQALGVEQMTALADTGYHQGQQLAACHQENIDTIVATPQRGAKGRNAAYTKDKFSYDQLSKTLFCPQGNPLKSNGTSYKKKDRKGEKVIYHYSKFTTDKCKTCPARALCLTCTELAKNANRSVEINEFQTAIDKNKTDLENNKELYKERQAIVEHPFGTIKRNRGMTHTYMKGLKKVKGEFAIVFTTYNLRRAMSIWGAKELISRLKAAFSYFFHVFFQFYDLTVLSAHLRRSNVNTTTAAI